MGTETQPKTKKRDELAKNLDIPVTHDSQKFPWHFRSAYAPTENSRSYDKFVYYMNLDIQERYLKRVAEHFDCDYTYLTTQAKKHQWKIRAAAHDEHKALEKAERDREERHQAHIVKLEQFRGRSEQLGAGLITAAAQLLQAANHSINQIKARGDVLDTRLISGALNASAKCAEAGRLLTAQSLGIDALVSGLDDADGSPDDYT